MEEAARKLIESKLLLSGINVRVDAGESICPVCGSSMTVQKTSFGGIVTKEHGALSGWWPTHECPKGCKDEDGRALTRRAEARDSLAMKNHTFGYDIEAEVGICRYLRHMQIDEISERLGADGIKMSPASISRYSHQFLDHLEQLHVAHLPEIARAMADEGGYYMHFDSTCEAGAGSLFSVLAGWRNWTLGSWRQSTENAGEMLPHVLYLIRTLGLPLAIMKDLSTQGHLVVEEIERLYPDAVIRIFACHYHFVQDIGKDILLAGHNELKSCIRGAKATLSRLIRDTRDMAPDDPADVGRSVAEWLVDPENAAIKMEEASVAIVRYLAQWVLDSSRDGDGNQFPFELPYLLFFDRITRMSGISATLLENSETDPRSATYRLLNRLHKATSALAGDRKTAKTAATLRSKNSLFVRLREALRLENTARIEDVCKTVEQHEAFHRKAKTDFDIFVAELRKMQNSPKIKNDLKNAIGTIIEHVEKYNDELWGHDIHVTDKNGNVSMRVANRTNTPCEQAFSKTKSNERRRSGRKNLRWDMTVRPAAASLVENLRDEEYLMLVCNGSLGNLPGIFAALENSPDADIKEQWEDYRKSIVTVFDSGRLSRADAKIIRSELFNAKITQLEAVST